METNKRKAVVRPIIQAAVIMAVFYVTEIIWVYLDVFPDHNTLLIADIILRAVCGTAGLLLLKGYGRSGESKYTLKQLFTNKITVGTLLVTLPFIIYTLYHSVTQRLNLLQEISLSWAFWSFSSLQRDFTKKEFRGAS